VQFTAWCLMGQSALASGLGHYDVNQRFGSTYYLHVQGRSRQVLACLPFESKDLGQCSGER
jgi:hypothetical protein